MYSPGKIFYQVRERLHWGILFRVGENGHLQEKSGKTVHKVNLIPLQGSYRSWKSWKVMESYNFIFQAWKVMEFRLGHGKSVRFL